MRSDSGEGDWSIELTFLSQLKNLAADVGMKIRIVIIIYSTSVLKTEKANEQTIHDFTKNLCSFSR